MLTCEQLEKDLTKIDESEFVGEEFQVIDEWEIGRFKMKKGDRLIIYGYGSHFIEGYFKFGNKRLSRYFKESSKKILNRTGLVNTAKNKLIRRIKKELPDKLKELSKKAKKDKYIVSSDIVFLSEMVIDKIVAEDTKKRWEEW